MNYSDIDLFVAVAWLEADLGSADSARTGHYRRKPVQSPLAALGLSNANRFVRTVYLFDLIVQGGWFSRLLLIRGSSSSQHRHRVGFPDLGLKSSAPVARTITGISLTTPANGQRCKTIAHQSAVDNSNATASAVVSGSNADVLVLQRVPEYLAKGLELKRWWTEIEQNGGPPNRFPLERSFNRPTRSFGFYADAPVGGTIIPVMGNVQEMFYDQTRAPASLGLESSEWMAAQLREFVLKYFMRVSSFRQPEAYVGARQPVPPPALARLSWCPDPTPDRIGFGFSQLFYKLVGGAEVRAFPSYDRFAIVDQREVGKKYDWLIVKVRIFDFSFSSRPFGQDGPELVFGANEESYLIVHEEFVNDKEHPLPNVLGDYGIGYSFIKSPSPSPFGYGPGEFDAAIELINFRVYQTGYISVRMVFIANRPTSVANIVVDPVDWSLRLADVFSFGLASQFFAPAKGILDRLPLRFTIDPVVGYISVADALSGNYAAKSLCISLEQLEKLFLLKHFQQHYQTVAGSLLTWREIPDWLDEKRLPAWVISGASS